MDVLIRGPRRRRAEERRDRRRFLSFGGGGGFCKTKKFFAFFCSVATSRDRTLNFAFENPRAFTFTQHVVSTQLGPFAKLDRPEDTESANHDCRPLGRRGGGHSANAERAPPPPAPTSPVETHDAQSVRARRAMREMRVACLLARDLRLNRRHMCRRRGCQSATIVILVLVQLCVMSGTWLQSLMQSWISSLLS